MIRSLFVSAVALATTATAQFGNQTINYSPPPGPNNDTDSSCPSYGGAHLLVARGSLEAPGYGLIGWVKDNVTAAVPGSTAQWIDYPATLNAYITSESDGVIAMRQQIQNYIQKCNSSLPLVIFGYSQGAQVTADALIGQDDAGFPDNSSIDQPLPASTLQRVAAVVLMGDPTFVANETFRVGNATKNGLFARKDVSNFNIAGLAQRTKSYCNANDPYCASGDLSTGLSVHLAYVGLYGVNASNFIVNQIKAYYANGTSGGANGTSTTGGNGTSTTGGNGTSTSGGAGGSSSSSTGSGSASSGSAASGSGSAPSSTSSRAASSDAASSLQGSALLTTLFVGIMACLFL